MSADPYLHRDYLPFSKAAEKAERRFLDGEYEQSLNQVEKMQEIIARKLDNLPE